MRLSALLLGIGIASGTFISIAAAQDQTIVRVGSGGYVLGIPAGAKGPPRAIFQTENVRGKMPTDDWWSSLAWVPFSEPHFPHPLAVQAGKSGLRVYYPGSRILANNVGIFGVMPPNGQDVTIGHSALPQFADARVDGFNDWFVTTRFGTKGQSLRVTYGHGSPFVFARLEGGSARLNFNNVPRVWAGDAKSPALGITLAGTHYGLFGPTGSGWNGLGTKTLTNVTEKSYFTLSLLPDASPETLAHFAKYAHNHVTDTRVDWHYDPATAKVTTDYGFTTESLEPGAPGTIFALYPHQWRATDHKLLAWSYPSVRGTMRLAEGDSFRTTLRFPGILRTLPAPADADRKTMASLLAAEVATPDPPAKDTYWEGKWLGKVATLVAIAEEYGQADVARALRDKLRGRLEGWLTPATPSGSPKSTNVFAYDPLWGTLIGYPASFGSDIDLNDHHFHYGYFLKAAAEVARHDPQWASKGRWGGMIDLIIRDVVSPRRDDPLFPFLRNFDPYAGHSWASGHAKFADGNNNESSSEAMNAWTALILWGEATGDRATRDLGVYLYTTEMTSIQAYWFDMAGENRPREYTPSVVTMVWGGKGVNQTWFTSNPEMVHGINWLPIHGGSLYLGHSPSYAARNYEALVSENGSTRWDAWADLVWMYRALSDPADALRQYRASGGHYPAEEGNSRANTEHWLTSLNALGHVDPTVTGDDPLSAVFLKNGRRTHVVDSLTEAPHTVTFSDGFRIPVNRKGPHH